MRKFFVVSIFLIALFVIVYLTIIAVSSWLSVSAGPALVVFDGRDTKLMLVWVAIAAMAIHFAICPEEWSTGQRRSKQTSRKNAMLIGASVAGILSLQQFVFSGGYLAQAEEFARAHGYSIVCDEISYKYGRELIMAKSKLACED